MSNVTFKAIEEPVEAPKNNEGIVAFQMVEYVMTFYGNTVTNTFDTKVMKDGSRIVVNGDGFFESGHRIH